VTIHPSDQHPTKDKPINHGATQQYGSFTLLKYSVHNSSHLVQLLQMQLWNITARTCHHWL